MTSIIETQRRIAIQCYQNRVNTKWLRKLSLPSPVGETNIIYASLWERRREFSVGNCSHLAPNVPSMYYGLAQVASTTVCATCNLQSSGSHVSIRSAYPI